MNNLAQVTNDVVSFEDEELILVDQNDNDIGYLTKDKCHDGDGQLHRAFSLFVFNEKGELLLQRRSQQKRLWPMFWSNTVCSHPRKSETMDVAVGRRLKQELGMQASHEFLFKFEYQVPYEKMGSEHELCWVYLGKSNDPIIANTNEVDDWRFISIDQLEKELEDTPDQFTPWMKIEWNRIRTEYKNTLDKYL